MTQQVNISECARLYGKDRRWVYNRIKQHGISTQQGGGNTGRHNKESAGLRRRTTQVGGFPRNCGAEAGDSTSTPGHRGASSR